MIIVLNDLLVANDCVREVHGSSNAQVMGREATTVCHSFVIVSISNKISTIFKKKKTIYISTSPPIIN